jgi:ribose/xylose/arabinose/galactoside ABC-type transport system permease subunit
LSARRNLLYRTPSVSRFLVTLGLVLLVVGLAWPWLAKIGFGSMPGDIRIERKGYSLYFPITSSVVVSLVLTLIFWILRR